MGATAPILSLSTTMASPMTYVVVLTDDQQDYGVSECHVRAFSDFDKARSYAIRTDEGTGWNVRLFEATADHCQQLDRWEIAADGRSARHIWP